MFNLCKKKTKGLFWHVHHDVLLEYCYNLNKRVRWIETHKHKGTHKIRLRLMQPVRGRVPRQVRQAGKNLSNMAYWRTRRGDELALQIAINNNYRAILALHEKECPDCPWDGETIFPKQKATL